MKQSPPTAAIYLYGVTAKLATGRALTVLSILGVDGKAKVEPMECASLVCWISHVSRKEFADNLARNMENLDWLSEAGVRHQRAVSAIAEVTDILPARFGTVFLNVSSLEDDMRKRKSLLEADLRKIHSCDEWGVKVFSVEPKTQTPTKKPKTGREYLKIKAALVRRPADGVASEELESFLATLRKISADVTEGGRISGGRRGLQWQSSLLVNRSNRKRLEAALKKYSNRWADSGIIECTGPWPPYSFVSRQ